TPPGYATTFAMLAIGVLALVASVFFVKRALLASLLDVDSILAKAASGAGDLSTDATEHPASLLNRISRNYNALMANLRKLIDTMRSQTVLIASKAVELKQHLLAAAAG